MGKRQASCLPHSNQEPIRKTTSAEYEKAAGKETDATEVNDACILRNMSVIEKYLGELLCVVVAFSCRHNKV